MLRLNLIIILFLALVSSAEAQWRQLPGPPSGGTSDFLVISGTNGGRIYTATQNGVFLSTDSAKSWAPAGLQGKQVYQIIQLLSSNQEILFASASDFGLDLSGYYQQGIFRSSDSGRTWLQVYSVSGIPDEVGFTSIASIAVDGQTIFLALGGLDTLGGILQSMDSGNTWERIADAPPGQAINEIVVSGDYIIALAYGQYIWRMPVGGGAWVQTGNSDQFGQSQFGTLREFIGKVFLCGDSLYISTDNGDTWSHPANVGGLPEEAATGLSLKGDTIVVTTRYFGLFRSSDDGGSWQTVNAPGNFSEFPGGITYVNGQFIVGSSAGIMVSFSGENWQYSSEGEFASSVRTVADDGSTLFALTDRGIFRSPDQGTTWIAPSVNDSMAAMSESNDSIYSWPPFSHWNGSKWDSLSSEGFDFLAEADGVLLVAGGNDVSASSDGGRTWVLSDLGNGFLQSAVFADSGKLYAWGEDYSGEDNLFVSHNGGVVWDEDGHLPQGLTGYTGSCAGLGSELVIGCERNFTPSVCFARSTNGGQSWVEDSLGLYFVAPVHGHMLASIGSKGLVDLDADSILLPDSLVSSILGFTSDDQYIYVATASRGVWRNQLSNLPLSVSKQSNELYSTTLSIYPNPSSSQSTISFSLPEHSYISLKLYDELGILRSSIFDGDMDAGNHEIPFADPNLPNGMYEVVLRTAINRSIARLVIAR